MKSALIHALLGEPRDAENQLTHAARLPRSGSWAECYVDASRQIAEVCLALEDAESALAMLDDIALRDVGEMLPFYVITVCRVLRATARESELGARLAMLEELPYPVQEGMGFAGSAFPVARAYQLMFRDVDAARDALGPGDPDDVTVQAMVLQLELISGKHRRAIEAANRMERNPLAEGFRQVEFWRLRLRSDTYAALGRLTEAEEVTSELCSLPGGLTTRETSELSAETHAFAPKKMADLPGASDSKAVTPNRTRPRKQSPRLTRREREILALLAEHKTRAEIASQLFISLNTVKTHLKTIYRKLGVEDRRAAVTRARREGWI